MSEEKNKCDFCEKEAEFRLEGIPYCENHFLKNSKTNNPDILIKESKKGIEILCKACNKRFVRTSKRGKFCQTCINKSRREAVERMKLIRERKKENEIASVSLLRSLKKEVIVDTKNQDKLNPIKPKNVITIKNKNYYDILKESVQGYEGYEGILNNLPIFYKLLCKIDSDKKCPWSAKMLVHSALANLVLESDIIDDSIGPEGYLDDLFLCSYVLKEIRNRISKELITENINENSEKEEMLQKIYEVYEKSSFYLGKKTKEILNNLGLEQFRSFDYLYKDVTTYHLDKLRNKLMLLYAMLAVKINNKSKKDFYEYSKLKKHLEESPYFPEICRYMQFI